MPLKKLMRSFPHLFLKVFFSLFYDDVIWNLVMTFLALTLKFHFPFFIFNIEERNEGMVILGINRLCYHQIEIMYKIQHGGKNKHFKSLSKVLN